MSLGSSQHFELDNEVLLNHFAATGRGAGGRRTRNGSSTQFGILNGAFGAGLTNRSAGFSSSLFGFWIKNPSWFRCMNWFFNYSALLFFG